MHKIAKQSMILLLMFTLVAVPFGSSAFARQELSSEEPSAIAMVADLILLRPLGFLAFMGGTGLFIVTLPFSALGGNSETAADKLVRDPAAFTFQRALGEF